MPHSQLEEQMTDQVIKFSQQLAHLAKGTTDDALTDDLKDLVKAINDFRKGGEITLKLKLKPIVTTSGEVVMIDVQPEITVKLPKPGQLNTRMFPTYDGELQRLLQCSCNCHP